MRLARASAPAGAAGLGPGGYGQLRITGTQLPIIGNAIARCRLAAVRLAVLSIADHDRRGVRGIQLLQAAETVVAAVEACKREHHRALLMAIPQLVRQLRLGAEVRAAGKEGWRLTRNE